VNGSENTAALKRNLTKNDNKIVVTTIQKLNNLMKSEGDLPVYGQQVVFIFDECHRSQFGEAQANLKRKFKRFYQFGFTGTPIFPQNASGSETTASVFGAELHSYVITDAIRDEKVLKFKVDYNDVRPKFRAVEKEQDEAKLSAPENRKALLHPERIKEVSQYILTNFRQKTHRMNPGGRGFNAMFAVSSVDAAKLYYETLRKLQDGSEKPIKIATIFSFAANEEQDAIGDIRDESFDVSAMDSTGKEFLNAVIRDYNAMFGTSFSTDGNGFQNYYRDLANRVKSQEVDLLIVVGMFLTGFDAPSLNTLFVDKNLRYHGLIQAYSRTNRIFDATKTFGNIVAFRDLEQATIDAVTLFGESNTKNVVLEKSFREYMEGFSDITSGAASRGFKTILAELEQRFPDPSEILKEADKKDFAKLFGEFLKAENVLQNFDEYVALKALKGVNQSVREEVEAFKAQHHLEDDQVEELTSVSLPADRKIQDYKSTYNDIRDWLRREKAAGESDASTLDWDDVVFEVDLLKSQEINLDYILELIFAKNRNTKDKSDLIEEARRVIRASVSNRAKESLIVDFINRTNLDDIDGKAGMIEAFFAFAQEEQRREFEKLVEEENLNLEAAKRYITNSIKREFATENGNELNDVLPKMSPLNPAYLTKKSSVFLRMSDFVTKFMGVGGQI
jgi:type I restriction enzyme R subunit